MRYLLPVIFFITACASIQPLSGGDKDETAPLIISTSVDSASTNVTTQVFSFTFDEYIKTTKVNDLLIISPNQKINPEVSVKGKKLTIKLKDELIPNTTYTFQFNGSVIDLNESNPIENYKYIFSTGPYIDSLTHQGFVFNIKENGPCKNCNVHLYKSENDSIVLTQKPDYLTRTDESGKYIITNLPSNTFKRVAIIDENKNLLLDRDEYISLSNNINTDSISFDTLTVFPLINRDRYKASFSKKKIPGRINILMNKPIKTNDIQATIDNANIPFNLSDTKDTLSFNYKPLKDTTDISLFIESDTINLSYIFDIGLKYTPKIEAIKNNKNVILKLNTPIKSVDSSKLKIYSDTLLTSFQIIEQSEEHIKLQVDKKPTSYYKIELQSSAISDILNKSTKADTITIKDKIQSTSQLNLQVNVKDTSSTLLLYIKSGTNTVSFSKLSTTTKLTFKDLKPGNYIVSIVTDSNNNGLWDTGDFFLQKSPEKIQTSEPFEIRQNWDKELIINVL